MKKAIFTALVLALTFGAFQNSIAEMRTSATLANEAGMISDISQPRTGVPAGFIMAFPLNGSPDNPDWLECNGQAIPETSDLYKRGMRNTPNLYAGNGKGYFLRAGSTPGQLVADSFRSHAHAQPAHTHEWSGQLSSTAVNSSGSSGMIMDSGKTVATLAAQAYRSSTSNDTRLSNYQNLLTQGGYFSVAQGHLYGPSDRYGNDGDNYTRRIYVNPDGIKIVTSDTKITYHDSSNGGLVVDEDTKVTTDYQKNTPLYTKGSAGGTIGKIANNGVVNGKVAASGGDTTYYTGNTETAPVHYTTRYFIKIND